MFQENCKYLPGIKLGTNVIAVPDLESSQVSCTTAASGEKVIDTSSLKRRRHTRVPPPVLLGVA
jgi:hypothetical protein